MVYPENFGDRPTDQNVIPAWNEYIEFQKLLNLARVTNTSIFELYERKYSENKKERSLVHALEKHMETYAEYSEQRAIRQKRGR